MTVGASSVSVSMAPTISANSVSVLRRAFLTAIHENDDFFNPDIQTVFILGHYGEDEKPHLKAVQEPLNEPGTHPRLMEDVFDFTENWIARFKLLLSYADTIVGVYEQRICRQVWLSGAGWYYDDKVMDISVRL